VYWFSRSGPAATVRIYYEIIQSGDFHNLPRVTAVPMGVSVFPKELAIAPRSLVSLSHIMSCGHLSSRYERNFVALVFTDGCD
jgi:hypothetical protein